MINLIGNEIKKVFSRWAVKIVIIIAVMIMVVSVIIEKKFGNDNIVISNSSLDNQIVWYEEEIQHINKEDDTKTYIEYQTNIDLLKLEKEYFDKEEWKYECISNNAYDYIYAVNNAKYGKEANSTKLEQAENRYKEFLNILDNNNWREYTKAKLNETKEELEQSKLMLNVASISEKKELEKAIAVNEIIVEALEIRLNEDISYDKSYMDRAISDYLNNMTTVIANEDNKNIPLVDIKSEALIAKYVIDTEKELSQYTNESNSVSMFEDYMTSTVEIFLVLIIIIVAGSIISDEFNKGTIKQLLIRPYGRIKIWFAKYITAIIVTIISMIIISIIATVIFGLFFGFTGYSKYEVGVYDYNTGSAYSMNVFVYVGIIFISKLPYLIMLSTIAMFVGTILNNTAMAVAVPLLGTVADGIVSALLIHYEKFRFLKYFITPNWDWSVYNFGKPAELDFMSFKYSIAVYMVYLVGLVGLSLLRFKKEDIKNI